MYFRIDIKFNLIYTVGVTKRENIRRRKIKLEKLRISLAAARVNAEMTQEEVAKEMHVSKNTVVNWEKGKSEPSISQSRELSKLYRMPLEYIFLPYKSN